jgi:hypothetical protein
MNKNQAFFRVFVDALLAAQGWTPRTDEKFITTATRLRIVNIYGECSLCGNGRRSTTTRT